MNHDSQREKAQIAVAPAGAGRECQRDVPDNLDQIPLGVIFPHVKIFWIIREPGRVAQQFTNRDLLPGRRRIGKVLRERILQPDLALFNQHHDCGRSELLAHRTGLKDGFGLDRNLQFHIR